MLIEDAIEDDAAIKSPTFSTCVISKVIVELAEIERPEIITFVVPTDPPEGTRLTVTVAALEL